MSSTHAAMGVALAVPLAFVAPELAAAAALAAFLGGVFPDLDVAAFEHRKTLHFPEYYWLVALPALGVALVRPAAWSVGVAFFLLSAAVHSVADIFGGGLGLRPWLRDDCRGVYYHYGGRWIPPRHWIRYDGAPEDLLAFLLLAAPGLLVFEGTVRTLLVLSLVVSVAYALVRKRLPDWAPEWMT